MHGCHAQLCGAQGGSGAPPARPVGQHAGLHALHAMVHRHQAHVTAAASPVPAGIKRASGCLLACRDNLEPDLAPWRRRGPLRVRHLLDFMHEIHTQWPVYRWAGMPQRAGALQSTPPAGFHPQCQTQVQEWLVFDSYDE